MRKTKDQQKIDLNASLSAQDLSLKQFQIKQKTRLCVCLIFIIQWILKFSAFFLDPVSTPSSRKTTLICLPFSGMMALIIAGEYFLFKKNPLKVAKYSKIVDGILLLLFMGDWMSILVSILYNSQSTDPPTFKISVLLTISGFSWRTLFVTLLVQKWYCKMIAPTVATLTIAIYTVCLVTEGAVFMFLRAAAQIFNIIVILYCDDKVKWRLMKTNLEQDKWNQVNNFILDSIPENIMILDLKGEGKAKFMSEYCKSFLKKYNFLDDMGEFFKKVQDLKQQLFDSDHHHSCNRSMSVLHIERVTTCHGLFTESNEPQKLETLEDLVKNFKNIIDEKNLQERQFLMYNGKLQIIEEEEKVIKSIEVKISFVKHFEDDCLILIFRDTTQRDLLVALEQTNKYKDQLLASVSHELRAPLNGNINMVEGAINWPQTPEKLKETFLIPALRSSKFLLHMINDILDMSQIKEKKLRLAFQSGDLKETLKSTLQLVELQAKKKGIDLLCELDPSLPQDFCTDHIRLSQIVLNLLTNAIKFTKEGTVKLIAIPVKKDSSWFKIIVKDSGVGIDPENISKLFSNYTHIEFEGRQRMNPTGIGLGLNIAYNLAELLSPVNHRQGIKVTSSLNEGSTFSFIIEDKETILIKPHEILDISSNSCEVVSEKLSVAVQPTRMLAKLKPPELLMNVCSCSKVMVVDDNPFNTMAFETILSSLELKCDSVYSGSDCIKKLLNRQTKPCGENCQQYAVVFMDQEMPDMNGIETVNEIKRLQKENLISGMRIIGCTAHQSKDGEDKFMAAGLNQCIHKPISMAMIKEILFKE